MNPPITAELGELEIVEVYSYYDGPRLVSCKGPNGEAMLALWVGGETGNELWYVAPLTKVEFRNLRFGELELRAAFESSQSGFVWLLTERAKRKAEARRIAVGDLRTDWLPDRGEALELGQEVQDRDGNVIGLRPPDLVQLSAVEAIRDYFKLNREAVVTSRQLEVAHEDKFFHWITNRAIRDLLNAGELLTEEKDLDFGGKTKLIWPRGYRYPKRSANKVIDLVQRYSSPAVSGTLGDQGEMLVLEGFARRGFILKGRGKNQNGEKRWIGSNHDLDFIFERDGVGYGVEVKNTLGYMDHNELKLKIDMARTLGVKPVVAARMLPGLWIQELARAGGYGMILKYQLYPLAHVAIAQEIRQEMALPVDTPRRLADRTMDRFERWALGAE
jgi:hypothetical protein